MAAMSTGDPLARLGLNQHLVVVVAESKSSACLEAIQLYQRSQGTPPHVINMDLMGAEGAALHQALRARFGQEAPPYVFVNGEFEGGSDATPARDAGNKGAAAAAKKPQKDVVIKIGQEPASSDLASYAPDGATVLEQVEAAIAANGVMVIATSRCPFCLEVADTFRALGQEIAVFNVDTMSTGAQVRSVVTEMTGHKTVPAVWINKQFIGGCDSVKSLQAVGKLDELLAPLAGKGPGRMAPEDVPLLNVREAAADDSCDTVPRPLLYFPPTVDNNVIRIVGFQVVVLSVMAAAFYNIPIMAWVCVGILTDFVLRFVAGAAVSPLGCIALLLTARMKPKLSAGAPKQFAASVGVLFSGVGTALYLTGNRPCQIGGAVVWAMLAGAAGLEAFLDFCAGCWVFGYLVSFGIVRRSVYTLHVNHKPDLEYEWDYNMKRVPQDSIPQPQRRGLVWPNSCPKKTDVALKTPKTLDYKRQDFNLVKHVKFGMYNSLLGITGAAIMWKNLSAGIAVNSAYPMIVSDWPYILLAIVSGVLFTLFTGLFTLKAILHPMKVYKEFYHPERGNAASVPFIVLMMYAAIAHGECSGCNTLAAVLFWAGAAPTLALGLLRVGDNISMLRDEEHLAAAWIIPAVGTLIAPLVGPSIDSSYREAMFLWYGFSFMMWIILLVLTMRKAFLYNPGTCASYPMFFVWVAAPSVAMLGYQQLQYGGVFINQGGFDFFAKMLYFMALSSAFFLLWALARGYLGASFFTIPEWAYVFPAVALAMATMSYHAYMQAPLTAAMVYIAVAVATALVVIVGLHMAAAVLKGGMFRDSDEAMPVHWMFLYDEAMTTYLERLPAALESLSAADAAGTARFITAWRNFGVVLHEQAIHHKNNTLFPALEEWAPGVTAKFSKLNIQHAERLMEWVKVSDMLMNSSDSTERGLLIKRLSAEVAPWAQALLTQLEDEEHELWPMADKCINTVMQKDLSNKLWASSDAGAWATMLPWVVQHLRFPARRQRFLRTLLWGMMERSQQVGMYVARGVDAVMWADISYDMPQIVPRGMPGWMPFP